MVRRAVFLSLCKHHKLEGEQTTLTYNEQGNKLLLMFEVSVPVSELRTFNIRFNIFYVSISPVIPAH